MKNHSGSWYAGLAPSRHSTATNECLLSGVKWTWRLQAFMSAFDPSGHGPVFPCAVGKLAPSEFEKLVNFEQTRMPDGLSLGIGRFSSPSERRAPKPTAVGWLL